MSRSPCRDKNGWILGAGVSLLVAVAPAGVSAEGPGGTVWVAEQKGDSITAIDAQTNKVLKTIPGIVGPHNVQAAPDGKTVWATSGPKGEVVVIDTRTYEVRARVPVGREPVHVVLTPTTKRPT